MIIKKGDIINIKELASRKISVRIISEDMSVYVLEIESKSYILQRVGDCDYKKCGSVCCKFVHFSGGHRFFDNFLDKTQYGHIIKKRCKYLKRSGKCNIWKHKRRPGACKQFPVLLDHHHVHIYNKCTIKFKVVGEIL